MTKPCLFGIPLTNAQKQKRWRQAHPEHRAYATQKMREHRERKRQQ